MNIFEYDVMDMKSQGRLIPKGHTVRFWVADRSYIEVSVGMDNRPEKHIVIRAGGDITQLQIQPEVSNTIRVSLNKK